MAEVAGCDRESCCQGLGLPCTCFFSVPRAYPTTGCHDSPQDPRSRLWSGWTEESPPHTPKEHLLGHCQVRTQQAPCTQAMYKAWGGMVSTPFLLGPCPQSWLLTQCAYGSSGDSPTYGCGDSSKGSPQLNWGQHWPASRPSSTGTKPGSGQVVWGQGFLWQVSVASLQVQSSQPMLMVWPGYGRRTRAWPVSELLSPRAATPKPRIQVSHALRGCAASLGERALGVQGLRP